MSRWFITVQSPGLKQVTDPLRVQLSIIPPTLHSTNALRLISKTGKSLGSTVSSINCDCRCFWRYDLRRNTNVHVYLFVCQL